MLRRLALTAALLAAFVVPGAADTMTESFSFPPKAVPFLGASSSIPDFNPALGTLESVTISLSATTIGSVTIGNDSEAKSGHYHFTLSEDMTLLDPSLSALFGVSTSLKGALVIPSDGIGTSALVISPTATDSAMAAASTFGLYEGTGTYTLGLFAGGPTADVKGPGPFLVAPDETIHSAGGTVTYTFAPVTTVPEPATLGLFGLGVILTGLAWRRKKAVS